MLCTSCVGNRCFVKQTVFVFNFLLCIMSLYHVDIFSYASDLRGTTPTSDSASLGLGKTWFGTAERGQAVGKSRSDYIGLWIVII